MIEQYEKEAMKDLESFYGTELELTDKGKAWVAGYVQAKLRMQSPAPKIDWSRAPNWANWWAMDANNCGYWFEEKPEIDKNYNWWGSDFKTRAKFDWHANDYNLSGIDWRDTLTRRPADSEIPSL